MKKYVYDDGILYIKWEDGTVNSWISGLGQGFTPRQSHGKKKPVSKKWKNYDEEKLGGYYFEGGNLVIENAGML